MGLLRPIEQPWGPSVLRPPPRRQTKPPPSPARPGQPPGGHPARLPTATTRPTTNTTPGHTGRPQLDNLRTWDVYIEELVVVSLACNPNSAHLACSRH